MLIILILIIFIIFTLKGKKKILQQSQKNKLVKQTKIKYDKKLLKFIFFTAIILSVLTIIFLSFSFFLNSNYFFTNMSSLLATVFILLLLFLPILSVIFWFLWIDGKLYLKDLKKFGYLVPENKKAYNDTLEFLPCQPVIINEGKCTDSYISAVFYSLGILAELISLSYYLVKYSFFTEKTFYIILMVTGLIIWTILTLLLLREADNTKYKNVLEKDLDNQIRKSRKAISYTFIELIILGAITAFLISFIFSSTEYIYEAHVNSDIQKTIELEAALNNSYIESQNNNDCQVFFDSMENETDFFKFDMPSNSFSRIFYEYMGINNINELKNQYKCNDVTVLVSFDGSKFNVSYNNPHAITSDN